MHLQAIMQAAQLKADGKAQRVIVTGCLAQRYSEDLAGDWAALHIADYILCMLAHYMFPKNQAALSCGNGLSNMHMCLLCC